MDLAQLAGSLKAIISQQLVSATQGGRVALFGSDVYDAGDCTSGSGEGKYHQGRH